jgi:hypothetical protein
MPFWVIFRSALARQPDLVVRAASTSGEPSDGAACGRGRGIPDNRALPPPAAGRAAGGEEQQARPPGAARGEQPGDVPPAAVADGVVQRGASMSAPASMSIATADRASPHRDTTIPQRSHVSRHSLKGLTPARLGRRETWSGEMQRKPLSMLAPTG